MKKKILIIDDEIDLVDLVRLRLEAHDYYIIPLYTSIRALEITKREKPDLVLLDVMMPDKDGYEVCKELKSDEETRNIPVILFTAKPQQKEFIREEFKSVGAEDYILKPFDQVDLLAKVKRQLREKEER